MKIIIFFLVGITIGFILRKNKKIINISDSLSSYTVYILVLTLGLMVGCNELIMNNLRRLGFIAFLITIASLAGTYIVAYFTEIIAKKKNILPDNYEK